MTHAVSAAAQVRALAKAVSTAFASSALTDEEKSPGKIEITDLPWQAPPLITPAILEGGQLQDFFDVPLQITQHALHAFWVKTLEEMWFRPSTLLRRGVLANCSKFLPHVRAGQRAFRFSTPAGWPACDELSGVMFSLEVAHAARVSLPILHLESTEDDYYVEFAGGMRIGVIDGKPACASPWQASAAGMVQELLTMPRGEVRYACEYDQIASLRSVLYVQRARFPHNFEALDQALQALRLLSLGSYCPELLARMRCAPLDLVRAREEEAALYRALDVVDSTISDRAKLMTLHEILVPTVVGVTTFKKHVFSSDQYPFTLARGKLEQIRGWLLQRYGALPAGVQKAEVLKS